MTARTAYIREYARSIATDRLAASIDHARALWGCIRNDRYDSHYARMIGVYRAELKRRAESGLLSIVATCLDASTLALGATDGTAEARMMPLIGMADDARQFFDAPLEREVIFALRVLMCDRRIIARELDSNVRAAAAGRAIENGKTMASLRRIAAVSLDALLDRMATARPLSISQPGIVRTE